MEEARKTREDLLAEIERLRVRVRELEGKPPLSGGSSESRSKSASDEADRIEDGYSIKDLVDLNQLRGIFEKFSLATGFPAGILDYPSQEVLIATGWQDACKEFHRAFPESAKHCKESNVYLTEQLRHSQEQSIKQCENGLIDGATPIIIRGKHIATLAIGQVLFSPLDVERFRKQAETYGYNWDSYLDALKRVPVVSEEQFRNILSYLSDIAVIITDMGLSNLEIRMRSRQLEEEIAQRRKAEEALRESEARFRSIAEQSLVGIYILQGGRFTYANQGFSTITGFSLEEMQSWGPQEFVRLIHPDDQAYVLEQAVRKEKGDPEASSQYDFRAVRPDGEVRWVTIISRTVLFEETNAILAVVVDITESRRAEEERRKLEAQVQYAQKLESLGVLAGGIAHDFNNLLTAILGNADLALNDLSPECPAVHNLREIEQASHRAADLCRQMLAYSGKGRFVVEPINISRLVKEMSHMLGVSISKKTVLRYHFDENPPMVEADATQIRQVVMNLILNASEALGDKEGVVAVTTGCVECDESYHAADNLGEIPRPGLYVFLEVADTGCGMDNDTVQKIFDPFFTTKFTGRGLGLAAVLGIVRGHGGFIRIWSEPGRGTTFRVFLRASERSAMHFEPKSEPAPWRGSGAVLVVDDEEYVRSLAGDMLVRCGFEVLTASDGREALEVFREHTDKIACVLLDLTMPRMDGVETLRELRRLRPSILVIVASGYTEEDVSQRFADQPPAGFIHKPFQLVQLRNKLHTVLESLAKS